MSDSSWSALGAWTHDRLGQIGQIVTSPAATAWETASSAFGFGGGTPAAAAPSVPLGDDDAEQVPTPPHDCAAAARCRDAWLTARALCRAPPAAPSASARLLQTMMRHLLSQERNGQNYRLGYLPLHPAAATGRRAAPRRLTPRLGAPGRPVKPHQLAGLCERPSSRRLPELPCLGAPSGRRAPGLRSLPRPTTREANGGSVWLL